MSVTAGGSGFYKGHQSNWGVNDNDQVFNKTQQQFPNIGNNSNFVQTNTTWVSTTPVIRPSIMEIMKFESKSVISNTFKGRSHSLNESARKNEQERVLKENHKIFIRVDNASPTPDLSVTKLKKQYEKSLSLKKLISTKYLNRDEKKLKMELMKKALPPLQTIFGKKRNGSVLLGSEASI